MRPPIHIHLQRTFWRFLSFLLRAIVVLVAVIISILRISLIPLRWVGKVVFVVVLVNLYKLYFMLKIRLASIWRPAKNRVLFPLSTRYVVHAVIIVLTIFVTTNSLKAREERQEDSFRPALLSGIIRGEANDEIVETADSVLARTDYYDGIGGVSPLDVATPSDGTDVATTQESSSLIKPSLASTTVGERPREGVVLHDVEGGETIGSIAERYGISINTILWENRLGARDFIQPGQQLTVLQVSGVSHQVKSGDTVTSLAKKYDADEAEIIAFNKLADASAISADQVLIIPHGRIPPPPTPVPTVRLAVASGDGYDSNPPPSVRTPQGGGLLWPTTTRKINQYFTYRHTGIDVDGEYSSPIYAAQSGRVVFVGWGGGYGLHVIVDHGNGMQTLYGHASKTFVKNGQTVDKGQTLAMQGSTGWSTGVHLHFEVRINGRRVNPFSYL